MIPIKKVKEIREQLGLTHIAIFGITSDGKQHVATHGKTVVQAEIAANIGNQIKKEMNWPTALCNAKPLKRICEHCSFFQRGYHRPGDVIEANMHGKCMFNPEPVRRFEQDRACSNFEPSI